METAAWLREVGLFRELGTTERMAVAAWLREVRLRRGQRLFREGDRGRDMYFVREGTLLVSKAVTDHAEQVLARVGPGDCLGEMSVFDGAPRSASVHAETDGVLLALDREGFEETIARHPEVAARFFRAHARAAAKRLRASDALVAEVTRWAVEATSLDLDVTALARLP